MTTLVLLAGWMAVSACSTGSQDPKADKDLEGGVSFTAFDAHMKESIFTEFDANGDGVVTMAEWRRMDPKSPASKFTTADSNGDGRVTRAESDAKMDRDGSMKKLFKQVDTDGSGRLNTEEIAAFHALINQQSKGTELEKLKQAADQS